MRIVKKGATYIFDDRFNASGYKVIDTVEIDIQELYLLCRNNDLVAVEEFIRSKMEDN